MLYSNSVNNKFSAVFVAASFTLIIVSVIRVSSLPGDMPFIRHGRSRVRHSNEKDHIRWGLQAFDNLTLDYEIYDNDTVSAGSGSGNSVGQLFGSDFWLNSDSNGTLVNVNTSGSLLKQDPALLDFDILSPQISTTTLPQAVTISQTTKIKKIHKKKLMENIRENVNKGLEYLKMHTNLADDEKNILNPELISQSVGKLHEVSQQTTKIIVKEKVAPPIIMPTTSYKQQVLPELNALTAERNSIVPSKPDNDDSYNANLNYKKFLSTTPFETTEFYTDQLNEAVHVNRKDYMEHHQHGTYSPNHLAFTDTESEQIKSAMPHEEVSSEVNLEEINIDGSLDDEGGDNVVIGLDNYNAEDVGNSFSLEDSSRNMETNKYFNEATDDANEDELYDWDEISRNNRRNLMRGRDVVTRFLQIVETQHSLGSNCEAGTSLNLGEGVVDRYAQDRFRVEAEVAVNRANMLTRIFKMASYSVQSSVNLLHASVLSMVEFDDDIFAAGNCFDWNQHPSQPGLFCPFAYRLPPPNHGALFAKDLATEYHYLGNTSEWFFLARKNAEKVIARNDQFIKAFHLYSNKTEERIEEETLFVRYEDGRWSKPYYDCGGGNIWMLTYTVPFFGYENGTYFFKGTSGIDIDLRRVDIDQCPQRNTPGATQPLNIFAGTDKCKQRTTMCEALKGLGFRRGSYKCVCRKGFYFPDTLSVHKFFNGSVLEEEYEKLMLGKNSTYNIAQEYECLPCAEGCESCEDGSPCIAALNWPMRTSILVLACTIIGLLPPAAWFTFRYQQVKVVRAASPALLRVIAMGAFFIYFTTIVMYPNPSLYTCTAKIWLREIGFSLTYGALMLKTWRISVIFRVRSAKAVKITDAALLKRLGVICGVIGTFLLVRTLVSPPDVVVGRTADDLKAFLCKTDWWDYTFTSMEVLFLAWGVRLCIMVRKAPSEFNESRFISMAIYNEFLLTCFLNVSMLFLQSPANPDLLYIIFFCHTQLTVTLLLGLIFGSKVYIVLRSGKAHQESIGMGAKSSGAKFNFRPQVRTFANPSSATTSTAQLETKLSDQEALEEVRLLSVQLQRIQEMAPPKGVAVMTISHLLDGLKTSCSSQSQNTLKSQQQIATCNMQIFSTNSDIQKYQQNNNYPSLLPMTTLDTDQQMVNMTSVVEKSVNTSMTGEEFMRHVIQENTNVKCDNCIQMEKVTRTVLSCQQLGSPQPDGSINFSNIKLDCMCSHPGDLDRICETGEQKLPKESPMTKTVATNTIMLTSRSGRRNSRTKERKKTSKYYSSSNLGVAKSVSTGKAVLKKKFDEKFDPKAIHCDNHKSSEHFLICSSCRNKLSSSLKKLSSLSSSRGKSRMVMHQSNELLDRSACEALSAITGSFGSTTSTIGVCAAIASSADDLSPVKKKIHSTDDITFYTTDDDSNENPNDFDENAFSKTLTDEPSTSSSTSILPGCVSAKIINQLSTNESQSNLSSASGGVKQTIDTTRTSRRPDKLLLDLNDRSKYTKEVSV